MGMYDEVEFDPLCLDKFLPGLPSPGQSFQTRSLHKCMDRYFVTAAGRLCLAGNSFADDDLPPPIDQSHLIDTEFHGDIRLVAAEPTYDVFRARFTHGTLDWIRRADEIPQIPGFCDLL